MLINSGQNQPKTTKRVEESKALHKRVEEALMKSVKYFQTIIDCIGDPIFVKDQRYEFVFVNDATCRMLDIPYDRWLGKTDYDLFPKEQADVFRMNDGHVFETGEKDVNEEKITDAKGNIRTIETKKTLYVDKAGEKYIVGAIRDITERKRSEEALLTSRLHLSEAMDLAKIVYWEIDPTDGALVFNDPFYAFYGTTAEEEGGYRMTREEYSKRFVHPDDRSLINQAVARRITTPGPEFLPDLEHRIIRRNGEVRHILVRARAIQDSSGSIVKRYGVNQDITERKSALEEKLRLELQLLQAQKMEALGTLAGGIAHDFNNVLEGIIGFAEMIKEDAAADSHQHRRIGLVLKGAKRGRDLVRQILMFSRRNRQEQKPVSLGEIVDEGLRLLRPTLPSTIEIRLKNLADDDTIYADSGQIHQVLMNLCTNAAHAMRETGGFIEIDISQAAFAAVDLKPLPDMRPGTYVVLTVRDTGCGMEPEMLDRIFDPFYTTKGKGEGTGLGLSVVHGIIKGHGGYTTVRSEPGKGSTFQIYLPKNETEVSTTFTAGVLVVKGGKERILFVDDEDILVDLGNERLKKLGYDVTATTSSIEALDIFKKEHEKFDLVITDYTMPHLTGIELATELLKVRADIPIILCTGHNDDISPEITKAAGIRELLIKPQSRDEIAQTIRRVLDTKAER
jgi:two-component system, cell cycle sensor histidine kinase and response regulator CckA